MFTPSLLQGVWDIACILLLPWMPESPRWLVDVGRGDDALTVLARINAAGDSACQPGIYASVAMIFIFSACFGLGWIPILFLIPAEMLNFSIRAWGMSMFSFVICVTGIWANFAFLFALENIGWRLYIINGAWDICMFVFIAFYWVEVRGKTLEEIDALIDGKKHSDVPDLELLIRGAVYGRRLKDKFAACLTASYLRKRDDQIGSR